MNRSFANRYARKIYSRDWLATFLARTEGTTALCQMRALQKMKRDDLISMLRDIIRHEIKFGRQPSNSVRAGYIAERLGRYKDRLMLRQWCSEQMEPYELGDAA